MQEEAEVAAQTNNVQAMEDMIKKNPNAKLDKLLAIATLYNSVPLVNHLIGKLTIHDLDCKKFTSVGDLMTTLLDLASQKNNLDVAQIITENGANMKDDKPLTAAVREGHVDMVRLLLNKGTDIAGRGGWVKYKPLVAAATKGHKEVVQLLVESGADLNDGGPLAAAARKGHLEVAKLLMSSGADINFGQPLAEASREGHIDVAKLLMDKKADINHGNPLSAAAKKGHIEVARMLLKSMRGANAQFD